MLHLKSDSRMVKVRACLDSLGVRLHWPIVRILHARQTTTTTNLKVWQQRVEDELIITTWPLRALTDERITLAVEAETSNGQVFKGKLKLFKDRVLKEGLNLVLLQREGLECNSSNSSSSEAEAQLDTLERIERAFYARDRNSVPEWYVQMMRKRLAESKAELLDRFPGIGILQLILPKPTYPLILDDFTSSRSQNDNDKLSELDSCSIDLLRSRQQSKIRKQYPSLFNEPTISNRSLRALHAMATEGFFASVDQIGPERCQLLWTSRHFLAERFPSLLPAFIQSVQWWLSATDREEISEAFKLLEAWRLPRSSQRRIDIAGQILHAWPKLSSDGPEWISLFERLLLDAHDLEKLCRQWIKAVLRVLSGCAGTDFAGHLRKLLNGVCSAHVDFGCQVYWMVESSAEFSFSAKDELVVVDFPEAVIKEVDKQRSLFDGINSVLQAVERRKVNRLQRIELLRHMLADPDRGVLLRAQQGVLIPGLQQPDEPLRTCALVSGNASLFKSTALAAFLPFLTAPSGAPLPLIYKRGDDLRRDDSILRIFRVLNDCWRTEAGLHLIPKELLYGVLPTGSASGWVEFVESRPISALLQAATDEHKKEYALLHFLQATPEPAVALNNFLTSCVGFSLLTFAFGVGDRHLDNLLVTPKGHLLHIDFAFLFGSDPKPFAPPVKLSREMIRVLTEGPGGWTRFKELLLAAFGFLRGKAAVIEALVRAEFPADAEAPKFVRERLMLGVEECEALQKLDSLIEEARFAMLPQVLDKIHQWAQYWKS